MAEKIHKTSSKVKEKGDHARGDQIELVDTLRMKKVPTKQDVSTGGVLPHNEREGGMVFEDTNLQSLGMPEQYDIEKSSIENINQV